MDPDTFDQLQEGVLFPSTIGDFDGGSYDDYDPYETDGDLFDEDADL